MIGENMKDSYYKSQKETLETLNAPMEGLSKKEVMKRQAEQGRNELHSKKARTIFDMLLEQLTDKMIMILFIASILSFFLGETLEGIVILVIICINATVSIIQEKKAADAIAALKKMNAPYAYVLRNHQKEKIPVAELVTGDIVYLEDGNIVPADIRLLEERQLTVDESSLTGESVPVEKDSQKELKKDTPLAERTNMVYSSTIITYGSGLGVVTAIGMDTEVGKIARMLDSEEELETPLKKKLNKVGGALSIVGICISILIFIIGLCYGKDVTSLLMISISLAISVIPEGLPATATIVMALGVERMTKKNALVKKLPAVETLGNASVICTDKTGTLTENKMTVTKLLQYEEIVSGTEEMPKTISEDLIHCMVLCNHATIEEEKTIGDPTEGALLEFAKKQKFDVKKIKKEYPILHEQPFDSIRKRMTVVIKEKNDYVCYTKGAVEEMIELCTHVFKDGKEVPMTYEDKEKIIQMCETLSNQALRLLGYAKRKIKELPKSETEDMEMHLTFLGMSGMIDPPKKEVKKAIETCHQAGIRVIMITGDHKLTASAIARDLGILKEKELVVTGEELHRMKDEELEKKINQISVFARVTPEDKLRIVKALQKNKEVVAMTGDGVNDSPALKAADIGVAMGIQGTDVAKQAADMILLDDNFTTIEHAIREGRRVYFNIQKVIQFLLAGNISEVLIIFLAMVMNLETPILAIHILFVNLITDTLPALALGVDPEDERTMTHKPIKSGSLFEKGMVKRIIFHGMYLSFISLLAYMIGIQVDYGQAITMTFLVLCLSQIVHSLNQHSNTISVFSKKHAKNKYLYGAMLLSALLLVPITCIPPIAHFFSLEELNLSEWALVIMLAISPLVVVELVKFMKRYIKEEQASEK